MSIQHRLATPVIQPRMRFFDTDGKPLVGGKVYAFKVGTEEFKPTYRNSELTALNTNPVVLDGAGSALIYLRGANLLKIYDRHGNFIEERIEYQQRERAQFYDDYGRPLKNGYVYTYDYQSTIRKTSYSIDNVINTNPIVLDENGTALVNIVGAYRLRQYNSKNVFVGDQDFKRPPIKALTSVVYPLYSDDAFSTDFNIDEVLVKEAIPLTENVGTTFSIDNVSFRTPTNEGYLDEDISTSFSVDNIQITKQISYLNTQAPVENISTSFNIDNIQITKQVNYLSTTMDVESVGTTFSIDKVQITN
ncbi:hypothetical protein [Acinetobacter indicus]|uniref:hypothetical protein n=1 Tax=Acinetobacter indicus TaxID=756892 RepID=UPI0014441C56|nr:hypothetical protein [Acinetobacter indicus]